VGPGSEVLVRGGSSGPEVLVRDGGPRPRSARARWWDEAADGGPYVFERPSGPLKRSSSGTGTFQCA